ncbi:MAG: peptidase [Akkermansiaceae bacterium]
MKASYTLLLFLLTLPVAGFSPQLDVIEPRGGQRGTEVQVTFRGQRLYEPQDVLFYGLGITLKDLKKGKDHRTATATLVIAPDAALGEHNMRLRCAEGLSYLRSFWVGQFPSVNEARSEDKKRDLNDSFESPQDVPMNVTVHGVALNEDADYYRIQAKKGQRLSVEVEGLRLGRMLFDPYVAILNDKRFEIAASDDLALLKRDCATSVIVPEDGAYTILIRESSYRGEARCQYRLHVGDFPRPTAIFPPAAKKGETVEFSFFGDPTGVIKQQIKVESEVLYPAGEVTAPSGLPIKFSDLRSVNEVEPNHDRKTATSAGEAPVAFQGILSEERDHDWFKFSAKKGQNLRAQVFARSLRSPVDSVIQIRAAKDYKAIATNDDQTQGVPDSRIDFKVPEDGEYFIFIRDQLYRHGKDFIYRIEVAPRTPSLSLTLRPADRNDDQKYKVISIPRGNRLLADPTINRANIGCDLHVTATNLPPGVKLEAPTAARSHTTMPLLFEAAPDAPLGGGLFTVTGKDPKSGLTGNFHERMNIVAINNLGTFVSHRDERLAIVVTKESPFQLRLSVPPVPIVRNGTINLKITAERAEGFEEKIRVTIPWRPPGVNAPSSVEIPKGKNEVILTLNANSDAAVGDYKVAVTGTSNHRGEVRVSSRLHPLKVSEPFLGLAFDMAATEPGKDTQIIAKFEHLKPFKGEASLTMHALPHGVTAGPQKIKADTKELAIPLTVSPEARKGKHGNLFCQVIITQDGHPIAHNVGHGGVLRVDPPPPAPKKPAPKMETKIAKAAPKPPSKKPLSRLEQLRQQNANK